ncbi:MAG: LysM peptidoglycan-binding domain-containing protein [Patescibacteria group bacterium]|nr:LysM peptidoglycan-binding domain-containing protein [Patescibacteria group bacterium]MCL5113865.1 LysM peptidoglycan-binding domain-containing protein [Patescibacteria group bacterium]
MPAKRKKDSTSHLYLSDLKIGESYKSLFYGALTIVILIGIALLGLRTISHNRQATIDNGGISTANVNETAKPKNEAKTYAVVDGDNLWTISEKFYKTGYKWTEIAKINNLQNPSIISAGEKLIIPALAEEKTEVKTVALDQITQNTNKSDKIEGNTYTVQRGDDLWDISVRAYGDGYKWAEIARANNLANPQIIHSGNVFKIPRG